MNSNAYSHAPGNNIISITSRVCIPIIKITKSPVDIKYINTPKTNSATTITMQSSLYIQYTSLNYNNLKLFIIFVL
ncbi:hypothetical protein CF075_15395 [Clostridium botulinum]|nr:hypothetical protein B2M06_19755 [Clostridium botulinum]NFM83844.1 hypothetical protein [Clostridium botulinum]NFP09896.1 hypothetical protein [Clostridium botulinum]NFR28702.1 hypothetical protein [Clostridium botulinum]NFU54631.1 hypothetical protein [Clostridium botulinum]